ncbi:MAG: 30S ribosomal protein S16 [Fusobacteriaceae bacterium]
MLKLRLTRLGAKKRPVYRIVAMEALTKRDGKAFAQLGNYFPLEDSKVVLKEEEIIKLLLNGAQPTRTVKSILDKAGVWAKFEAAKKN